MHVFEKTRAFKKSKINDSVLTNIIKPQFLGKKQTMTNKIASIADGHYCGIIHKVEKSEKDPYVMYKFSITIEGFDEDTLFEHVEFVTEKNKYFLYNRVNIPLGLYASDNGLESLCDIEDLYVEFDKSTNYYNNKEYPQITFDPLFSIQQNAPVGSSNCTLDLDALFGNVSVESNDDDQETSNYESFDDEDVPF